MAKHCTTGIESRVSADRLILLDTQANFFPGLICASIYVERLYVLSL